MAIWQGQGRPCPNCAAVLDAAADVDDTESRHPEPGDATVCADCGAALIFTDTALRLATPTDLANMPAEARQQVTDLVASFRRRHA